jgi:hypothetical protein
VVSELRNIVEDYEMIQPDEKKAFEPTGMPARRCSLEGMSVKEAIEETAMALVPLLNDKWIEATKENIEAARKRKQDPLCQTASSLYVAYAGDRVLYVGETSTTIRNRFIGDGSGSHRDKREDRNWYSEMTHVRYVSFDAAELPEKHRKLFEQALAIQLKPEFYGRGGREE